MKMTVDPAPHLRRVGLVITITSLIAIGVATLIPESSPAVESHFCLICGSVGTVDAVLNVILFLPLGVGLALSGIRGRNAVVCAFVLSVLIETAQLFLIAGRDASVGDVLTNTIGGALGFAIGRYPPFWLLPSQRAARNLTVGWAAFWLTIQTISSYGFMLSLPQARYYGQIARELGNFAVFPGTVVSASVGDLPIPNTVFDDSRVVERLLLANATVTASVVTAKPPPKIAPIVRVVDAQQREIFLLAQDGDRFIFGVRTGAAAFHARPPFFALPGVFPTGPHGDEANFDSQTLTARYAAMGVTMGAHGSSTNSGVVIPIYASLGWTIWLPFQWLIQGTSGERVISLIWIGCLLIPLGYWAVHLREQLSPNRARSKLAFSLLLGAALLVAGLALIPYLFGLRIAPFLDWVATIMGLLIGYSLGVIRRRSV